jgi:hypothetical protein
MLTSHITEAELPRILAAAQEVAAAIRRTDGHQALLLAAPKLHELLRPLEEHPFAGTILTGVKVRRALLSLWENCRDSVRLAQSVDKQDAFLARLTELEMAVL